MTTRVRDYTKLTQQNEKMASLGRLSAGLAHELNNPVAAVVRSVDTLNTHLRATPEAFKVVMNLNLTDESGRLCNRCILQKSGPAIDRSTRVSSPYSNGPVWKMT